MKYKVMYCGNEYARFRTISEAEDFCDELAEDLDIQAEIWRI